MSVKELLPIGSIVLLKNGQKKLMICGIKQSEANGDGVEYDYLGVLYPEGHIGENFQYLFNHDDIEQIVFQGYEDAEREEFIEKLSALYDKD